MKAVDPLNLQELTKYFTKEASEDARKVGERAWTLSKGLKRPDTVTRLIPDNTALTPPAGSIIFDNPTWRTEYGTAETVFYMLQS